MGYNAVRFHTVNSKDMNPRQAAGSGGADHAAKVN